MSQRLVVTANIYPDLDGTAGAVAYAEFLQWQGKTAVAAISGSPHNEAVFVLEKYDAVTPTEIESLLKPNDKVILVDASEKYRLPPIIQLDQVTEIIDHRQTHHVEQFPNAVAQIELVGAVATLVAERFIEKKAPISSTSAALLFFAIVSNTINFKANVTTTRDIAAAQWLKQYFEYEDMAIDDIFEHKSQITRPLRDVFNEDIGIQIVNDKKISIFQLEIMNVAHFVEKNFEEIRLVLDEIQRESGIDFIFLTAVDIKDGYNIFVAANQATEKVLEKAIDVTFRRGVAKREGILMRKEIIPRVREVVAKQA